MGNLAGRYVDIAPAPVASPSPTPAKLATARKAMRETKPVVASPETKRTTSKGGRPRKYEDAPWLAAGMSRAAWYRKKAKA